MKYKVLKDFVTKQGTVMSPGYTVDWEILGKFGQGLLRNGFIQEIEETKVELSGQHIPAKGKKFWGIMFSRPFGAEPEEIDGSYAEMVAKAGLSFETKKECQKFIDRLEAYQILRQDAKGFKPDWGADNQDKWCGYYCHNEHKLNTSEVCGFQEVGNIFFASAEDVEESFAKHKKEWLTVLGVQE